MASPINLMVKIQNPSFERGKTNEIEDSLKCDLSRAEERKSEDKFFLNPTPLLSKKSKRIGKEGLFIPWKSLNSFINSRENPYSKLNTLGEEQIQRKKPGLDPSSRSHMKLESQDTSFSDELQINDLIQYELHKTENFKLGDLKQGIEENIVRMTEEAGEELDAEGKFNILLCKRYLFIDLRNHGLHL